MIEVDTVLLAMAMAALGLATHSGAIRKADIKPLVGGQQDAALVGVGEGAPPGTRHDLRAGAGPDRRRR